MRLREAVLVSSVWILLLAGCAAPQHRVAKDAGRLAWPARNPVSPLPHTVFGEPVYSGHDDQHNATRRYGAFTVYYDDRILGPRWTAIKMTSAIADANSGFSRPSRFKTDNFLRDNGFSFTTHGDYNNLPAEPRKWDRGHMVQFDDVRGYGDNAGRDSMFTTNVCPQLHDLNAKGWLALEKRMTKFARDYRRVWLLTGPIYGENPKPFTAGRRVPAPEAFYRIAVRETDGFGVAVVAFIMPQEPIPSDVDLSGFLTSIDEIEERTGLDFLRDLPDALEDSIEMAVSPMWPNRTTEQRSGVQHDGDTVQNIAASTWRTDEQIPLANDYEILLMSNESSDSRRLVVRHRENGESRAFEFADWAGAIHVMLPSRSDVEPLLTELDQDITHDGIPNLVVREYSGGGHCCTVDHILSLEPDTLVAYQEIRYGHGAFMGQHFVQVDEDDALEIATEDWTFAYWKMSFAESPAPAVTLHLRPSGTSGKQRWLFGNTAEPVSADRWRHLQDGARSLNGTVEGAASPRCLPELLSSTLDLIYTGNAIHAQEYVRLAFGRHEDKRLGFLVELALQINKSPILASVLELNCCTTVGQLLAGPNGIFGAWE